MLFKNMKSKILDQNAQNIEKREVEEMKSNPNSKMGSFLRSFLSADEKAKKYREDFTKGNWELRDVEQIRRDKYELYKKRRREKQQRGEDLSTSEDEYGVKKTGYELTRYMIEYNE